MNKPVGWIASRDGGNVLHFAQSDGWQVDIVMTVNDENMIEDESSAYTRLLLALREELTFWEEELANASGDDVDRARRHITAITWALRP